MLGERAYPSVADIPGPVDLAYILLGTRQVEGVVDAVAAKGIPVACVLADGFAEAGPEGAALQARAGRHRAGGRAAPPRPELHGRSSTSTRASRAA